MERYDGVKYKIAILEKDKVYLERLVSFLQSHHENSFQICIPKLGMTDWLDEKYDAIFIGEGMELSVIDILDEITIAYLTDESNSDNKLNISKYQKPEQIYNQMLEICQNTSKSKIKDNTTYKYNKYNDFILTTEDDAYGSYRVFKLPDDCVLDSVALGMLTNNEIEGVAGIIECRDSLKYKVTNKVSLIDYLCENNEKDKLIKIVNNILNTMLTLDEYMLDVDKLVLKPQEIYVDSRTLKTELLYYPLQSDKGVDNAEQTLRLLIGICHEIIEGINKKQEKVINESKLSDIQPDEIDEADDCVGTQIFPELQKAAEESIQMKKQTAILPESKFAPHLIRRKNDEHIVINRNIFKIGKDESYVDYCVKQNPTVSRNHADIIRKSDGYYIVDKGSLNHTFINGRRIEPNVYEKLEHEDLIQIADEVFEFKRREI